MSVLTASESAAAAGRDPPLTALRLRLRANGFPPVPVSGPHMRVKSAGKRPLMEDWRRVCAVADEAEVRRWASAEPNCTSTGILCDNLACPDIDVPVPELAAQIEVLAIAMLGPTSLRRIGQAPKSLLAYRTTGPLTKMATPELFLPDRTKVQVEILGAGQQFVAYGEHPDTGHEYAWTETGPDVVACADLPVADEGRLRAFVAAAEAILREAGGRTKAEREVDSSAGPRSDDAHKPDKGTSGPRRRAAGANFFQAVNQAALDNLGAWVPTLFPKAKLQATGAYRVTSADLGRAYEEDLSIHPDGVQDFGPRKGLSPCDLVMEWGSAPTVQAAARTLCEWLGRPTADFGWKGAADSHRAHRPNGADAGSADETLPFTLFSNIKPALDSNDFVEGLLASSSLVVIYGEPGSGKTFWVLDICLHVAAGRQWRDRAVEQGAVIYLALEGGAGIRNRIAAARERMALPDTTPLVLVQCPVDLCHGNADVAKVIATIKLIAVRLAMPVRIVVVDTLARAMAGGNENASEDMGALVAHSDLIRDQSGACVLYVHHCGKDAARGSRGHSSLKAATDTEIEVTRGAERVSIARVTRQRDMESEGSFGFKLDPMELGRNQRNKPVTSCVVTPADAPPEPTGTAPLTNVEKIAMRCLDQAMKADAIEATVFDNHMQGLVVRADDWRTWFYREGKPGADRKTQEKAFKRAIEGLLVKGRIATRDDLIWPTSRSP